MQSNNTGEDVHEATRLPPSWIPDNLLKSSDTENQKKKKKVPIQSMGISHSGPKTAG